MPEGRFYDPEVETMPLPRLHAFRDAQVRELVSLAYQRSTFYRQLYDRAGVRLSDIRGFDDLVKLPFIDKHDVRREQKADPPLGTMLTFDKGREHKFGYISGSGGTTGTQVMRNFSAEEFQTSVDALKRSLWMVGIRPGDRGYFLVPFERHMANGMQTHQAMLQLGGSHTNAGIADIPFDSRCEVLQIVQPTLMFGTPSYVRHLGEQLSQTNISLPVKTIVVAGEPGPQVSAKYRRRIGAAYGLDEQAVYECFGSTDATVHNMDCPEHAGIHLWTDLVVYEIVDPRTRERVPPGKPGIMVVTTPYHRSHPWIRYFTEDYAVIDEAPCPCGRTHPRLTQGIMGRLGAELYVGDHLILYSDLERAVAEIDATTGNYQVVRSGEAMAELFVRVELKPTLQPSEHLADAIGKEIRRSLGVPVRAELATPGMLPVAVWKAQRVVDGKPAPQPAGG